ncbi:MAG: pyrroline-5-carboxylate reductase [Peptostreptococcaceae bacterium]|nr:pyrroline-5-carboxylate reductase [Peptostreptococcaceae bacterium]
MKLGFIGMGNMAKALATGFINNKTCAATDIYAYAPNQQKLKANAELIGFQPVNTPQELIKNVNVIIVACKPNQVEFVFKELGDLPGELEILSIAAGWSYEKYRHLVGNDAHIQCVMPNTPAMIGEGVFLMEETNTLTANTKKEITNLFDSIGTVVNLPSKLMGIGTAISGCGPAFVDMMIEAYADAAVQHGIPREQAYMLVSTTIKGAAQLQLETKQHPAVLKDQVCSPGGTTIRGVTALEENGFRNACIQSINKIME